MLAHSRKGLSTRVGRTLARVAVLVPFASAGATAPAVAGALAPVRAVSIRVVAVKTGLSQPTAFTFTPGGALWYVEKANGEIHTLNLKTREDRLFTTIGGVNASGERGMLGIALHPGWPAKRFVYVYVTRTDGGVLVNEVLRIRADGGTPGAIKVLLRWRVTSATNHNGGRILFGPDRTLYIVTGENANPSVSQRVANVRGKVLRILPNGGIPRSNPFDTRIWSFGHRNSFGMAFDPLTGRLWETENGPDCNDEINLIRRAGNFAWGSHADCGSLTAPRDTNRDGPSPRLLPETYFRTTLGITGAAFCDRCGLGAGLEGDLLFGEVKSSRLWHANIDATRTTISGRSVILSIGTVIYSMEVGPNNRIYFSGPTGIYRLAPA